jgi:drug/metabolite transporter (DMT)-like permease
MNKENTIYAGIGLATLSALIWSGNYVVARGISASISPVSLAFYRWLCATICITPLAWKHTRAQWPTIKRNWKYLLVVSLIGISCYNTLIYKAAHDLPAVDLALLGTTSLPIFSLLLSFFFLRERILPLRIIGMLICLIGILFLLSRGNWENLKAFEFIPGDGWILLAAFLFSIYTILARKKPSGIGPLPFLFTTFITGTLILFPFYLLENLDAAPVVWNTRFLMIILYLGIGNSVLAYYFWNGAIGRLGATRTSLFSNLIPVFSSVEAVLFLGEPFNRTHWISALLVLLGLVLANHRKASASA